MIDITYGIWEVPGYDIYPACHSVLHKQLQNVYTRQKEKKKKRKNSNHKVREILWRSPKIKSGLPTVCQRCLQGNQTGREGSERERETRRRQWKSKFSGIIDFVLKQLLPDRQRKIIFEIPKEIIELFVMLSCWKWVRNTSISLTPHWGTFIHLKWYSNIV